MNWKKITKIFGVIIVAFSMVGCSSEGKLTKKEMEEVKEAKIKALEEMYPDRQFEVYDMKQYGDMYGYFQKYYYRCLNDGITFEENSMTSIGPEEYLITKWDNDGKQLVEKSREAIFQREGYCTFHISMYGGDKNDMEIYNPDFMVLDAFNQFNSKYTGSYLAIECMLYTEEGEKIDWKKEAEAIYKMYEIHILPYKNLVDFEYYLNIKYLKPGTGHYEMGDRLYTEIPKEFIKKRIILSKNLQINSSKDILEILNIIGSEQEE